MKNDFYIGQIFEGDYPPEAAIWCNANNAVIDIIGDKKYEIKESPVLTPTRAFMHELRKQAYAETTDRLSLERMRLQAIGQWNADKELEYQAKMAEMSEEIKAKYPFGKGVIDE